MITGILLAAGSSCRFGSDKLLHAVSGHQTLIDLSLSHLATAVEKIVCVVRPDNQPLLQHLQNTPWTIALCPQAERGMADSIKCGLHHAPDASAWLIALADMPYVQPATLRKLAQALVQHDMVAPCYAGRRGNPVGFSQKYYPQLMALEGDSGARALLKQYESSLYRLEVNDAGILQDIDTPADLSHLSSP